MIFTDGTHLISTCLDELHTFAKKIGLKRQWFQQHDKHPHYDLIGSLKTKAVEYGACVVSSRRIVEICNNVYKTQPVLN